MITDLPTKRITATYISRSFTYKMAAKINWHRYGTKLRHCHPVYTASRNTIAYLRHENVAFVEPDMI